MIWLLLIFVMLMILAAIWYYPKLILNPINSIYRTDRSERKLFYTDAEKREIFPVSLDLENNWLSIRTEGQNLFISLPFLTRRHPPQRIRNMPDAYLVNDFV